MIEKAALYLRSSKDRHEVSIDSQRRELEKYAEQNNIIITCEFVDNQSFKIYLRLSFICSAYSCFKQSMDG